MDIPNDYIDEILINFMDEKYAISSEELIAKFNDYIK